MRYIPLVVFCMAAAAAAGHALDTPRMASMFPGRPMMTLVTAGLFILTAGALVAMRNGSKFADDAAVCMGALILTVAATAGGAGFWRGVDSPGQPAIPTMLCFGLLGVLAVARGLHVLPWWRPMAAHMIAVLAGIALLGHAIGRPGLYWEVPGRTGMALPTAVLFAMIAASVWRGWHSARYVGRPWEAKE